MKTRLLIITILTILMAGQAMGQERGKHNIQLNFGLLSGYKADAGVAPGGISGNVSADGFMGSISYSYWIEPNVAFSIAVGALSSEVNSSGSFSGISVGTGSVTAILFGVKYQPWHKIGNDVVRPYLFASVGPCIGIATRSRNGFIPSTETYTESKPGSHFGFGTDVVLSRLFMLGISGGYYLIADFDKPIDSVKNYRSPSFAFSFGIMLGAGKK